MTQMMQMMQMTQKFAEFYELNNCFKWKAIRKKASRSANPAFLEKD